jgi:tetratricopeptide (TPR) repeat protein
MILAVSDESITQGDRMKQSAMLVIMLALATFLYAQQQTPATQNQPAGKPSSTSQGAPPATSAQGAAAQPAQPQGKRPPQAKTQPEFDAYKAATANTDPAALEKAADDFAAKFPDSELRPILYRTAMHSYQTANNAEKMLEMGRKVLKFDPDDPEALVGVAQVLAERTRDTDLDKDQRLDEATKLAQHSLETVDTDIAIPAGTPQDKVDAYKAFLRSSAYAIIGTIEFNREKYADAEASLRKSIDADPQNPDPVAIFRLAVALDKQDKVQEALKYAEQAVSLTKEGTAVGTAARNERDRLVQLNRGAAPGAKPPASAQNPTPH